MCSPWKRQRPARGSCTFWLAPCLAWNKQPGLPQRLRPVASSLMSSSQLLQMMVGLLHSGGLSRECSVSNKLERNLQNERGRRVAPHPALVPTLFSSSSIQRPG